MKKNFLLNLTLLVALSLGWNLAATAQTTTFNYTGSVQTYTVPSGVTSLLVDIQGAAGGASYWGGLGGAGGRVQCQLTVTPGSVLNLYVGGKGANGQSFCATGAGGFNGGASNGGKYYSASGGGASDIRIGGTSLSDRKIVAGGGGGTGANCFSTSDRGGDGGGLTGGNGRTCGSYDGCYDAQGGRQATFANGSPCFGASTYQGTLGNGGSPQGGCYYSGSGGGGYYGGGSAHYYGMGGGGSSFTDAALCSSVTHQQGFNTVASSTTGNGRIILIGPTVTASPTALTFPATAPGVYSDPMVFSATGTVLAASGSLTMTPTTSLYEISPDGTTWFTNSSPFVYSYSGTGFSSAIFYVRFRPASVGGPFTANITIAGGGLASSVSVALSGTGASACTGVPTAGSATINGSSSASGNSSTAFTLAATSATAAGGITYQWERATVATGPFSDIPGANTPTFVYTGLPANSWFRLRVTCPTFSVAYSSTVSATFSLPGSSCIPTCSNTSSSYAVGNGTGSPVLINGQSGSNINDASIYNSGTGGSSKYYNSIGTSINFNMGGVYTATLSTTSCWVTASIWIDFNDDGAFSNTTELVGGFGAGFGGVTTCPSPRYSFSFAIPSTATPGRHRMRVMGGYGGGNSPGASSSYPVYPLMNPCPTTGVVYSDTRDYTANIAPLVASVVSVPASLALNNVTTGTSSVPPNWVTLTASNLSPSVGLAYVSPPAGFSISTNGTTWVSSGSIAIAYSGAAFNTRVYVRFNPSAAGAASGNISITGGGLATAVTVPLTGNGASVCTGTPTAGTAAVSPSSGGTTTPFTLSLSGFSASGGLAFQWQRSTDGGTTWANLQGGLYPSFSFTGIASTTQFRCIVTCSGSGLTATTAAVTATITTPTYCNPAYSTSCAGFAMPASIASMTGVSGAISDPSTTCGGTGANYQDKYATTTVTLAAGSTYATSIGGNSYAGSFSVQVWIDFNDDGTFSATETIGGGLTSSSSTSGANIMNMVIPSTAINGTHRMRLVGNYSSCCGGQTYPNIAPCITTSVTYGETRDYKVVITGGATPGGGAPCSGTPVAGVSSAYNTLGCNPFTAYLFNAGQTIGGGISYNWQSSTTSATAGFTNISGATNSTYFPALSTAGTVYYRNLITCATGTTNVSPAITIVLGTLPDISSFTAPTATNSCNGGASTVTVNSTTLGAGTFTVTYNLSGANIASGSTATLTMGASSGTFSIPGASLPSIGATTVTITGIANAVGCTSNPSASNTATFSVGTNPDITNFTSPAATNVCAGVNSTATVNSTTLGSGTYTVTYNLTGANTATASTATLTMG
ncbi:MAG: hypothetical protein K9G49_04875, partial [Taibaiella sp.]|nr:hypothetical protein [Taibaiella sp.]